MGVNETRSNKKKELALLAIDKTATNTRQQKTGYRSILFFVVLTVFVNTVLGYFYAFF